MHTIQFIQYLILIKSIQKQPLDTNFANNVNRLIDNNEGIIVDHRSKSLLDHKYIYSSDFIGFKWSKEDINNLLQINKINYIVANDESLNEYLKYSK